MRIHTEAVWPQSSSSCPSLNTRGIRVLLSLLLVFDTSVWLRSCRLHWEGPSSRAMTSEEAGSPSPLYPLGTWTTLRGRCWVPFLRLNPPAVWSAQRMLKCLYDDRKAAVPVCFVSVTYFQQGCLGMWLTFSNLTSPALYFRMCTLKGWRRCSIIFLPSRTFWVSKQLGNQVIT